MSSERGIGPAPAGEAADPATDGRGPADEPALREAEGGDRRAALGELARWAALAPAVAVLFEPDQAKAY